MIKILHGPGGLTLTLDSSEIFPDDPGQGTPAMVNLDNASGTYAWAMGEGSLYTDRDGDVELSQGQLNWLDAQEDAVWTFIDTNDPNQISS